MDFAIFKSNVNKEAESCTICNSLLYVLYKISMDICRMFSLNKLFEMQLLALSEINTSVWDIHIF